MADPLEIVPDPKVTGRWADEADAEAETQAAATTSEEVALDSLTIEATRRVNNEVSDPDDSRIEAVTAGDTIYASAKKFEDLNLSPELLKGLYVEMKFEKPSKIQAISLPMILTPPFKNLVAQAHNGSGKTTCFVLGMLSRTDTKLTVPQALCICPTRELAIQNMEVLLRMGKFTGITSELAIPADSSNYLPVRKRPPITAQVVIGTPGTISNLVTLKKLSMSFMKILVFDEADHMLAEGGFRDDSRKIMKAIIESSPDCQVLLFSATFNDAVRAFVDQTIKDIFNKDCNQMFVKKEELSLASVKQYKVNCPDELTKIFFEAASLSQKVNCPDELTKVFFEAASLRKQFSIFYNIRKTANRVIRAAIRSRCHYVNKKWLDGMLTNWSTTETRLQKFRDLRMEQKTGILNRLPKRDAAMVVKDKILELGDRVGQTIIFVRTWKSAGMLHHSLVDLGYEVTTIQGALKQEDRDKIIKEFKEGLTSVLISTDVLARGFDQAQVNLVVNYDLPVDFNNPSEPDYEVYLHRVGRAGRFGRRGAVFNLLCDDRDKQLMEKIEKYFNCEIAEVAQWNSDEDFRNALKKAGLV